MMLPALGNAPTYDPAGRSGLYAAYLAALAERGAGNTAFRSAARSFLTRWPDPADWACEPLPVRLSAGSGTRPFLNFLMLAGFLQPGYDCWNGNCLRCCGNRNITRSARSWTGS